MCGESWLSVQDVDVLALHFQIDLTLADHHRGTGAVGMLHYPAGHRICGLSAAAGARGGRAAGRQLPHLPGPGGHGGRKC